MLAVQREFVGFGDYATSLPPPITVQCGRGLGIMVVGFLHALQQTNGENWREKSDDVRKTRAGDDKKIGGLFIYTNV